MTQGLLDKLSALCQPPYEEDGEPLHVPAFSITKNELAEVLEFIETLEDRLWEAAMGEDL